MDGQGSDKSVSPLVSSRQQCRLFKVLCLIQFSQLLMRLARQALLSQVPAQCSACTRHSRDHCGIKNSPFSDEKIKA